jgi:hypothetical protein
MIKYLEKYIKDSNNENDNAKEENKKIIMKPIIISLMR